MSDVITSQGGALAELDALTARLRGEIEQEISAIGADQDLLNARKDRVREKQSALARIEGRPAVHSASPAGVKLTKAGLPYKPKGRRKGWTKKPQVQQQSSNGPDLVYTDDDREWETPRPAAE